MKAMKEHAFEKNETTPDLQSAKDRGAAGKWQCKTSKAHFSLQQIMCSTGGPSKDEGFSDSF